MPLTCQFVGARSVDPAHNFDLDPYHLINASSGLASGNAEFYVFGQNLTDERPQLIGLFYGPGVEAVTVGPGRTIGVGGRLRF